MAGQNQEAGRTGGNGSDSGAEGLVSAQELERVVADLRVHQAELEVQNEELRTTQETLIETQRRYVELFEHAPVGYMTVDDSGRILETNRALEGMAQSDRLSLVGKPCAIVFHHDDRDEVHLFLRGMAHGGAEPREVRLREAEEPLSARRYVRLDGKPPIAGVAPCRIAVTDVTQQRIQRAERDAAADLLQRTIDGMDEPVMVVGVDHRVHFANRVARRDREATGQESVPCYELLHGWGQPCPTYGQPCPLTEVLRRPRLVRVTHEHVTSDDATRTLEVVASPFYGTDGTLEGIIERSHDVTDRLRRDQEIERAHKLESLGVLAGGVAHDFNNLLTALQGTTELAWQSAIDEHRAPDRESLEAVRRAFARAAALTRQLLTFSRGGAPATRACDLGPLVRDAATLAVSGSTIRCRFSFDEELPAVNVDPAQFGQVVHNIVINAVQAMPDGHVIDISAGPTVVFSGPESELNPGKYVRLLIRDDGPGIPPSIADRIFEPYFTTRSRNSGLGLAIVHSIVRRHGGAVRVTTSVGVGTELEILMPQSPDAPKRDVPPKVPASLDVRVLVMDDEPQVRWLLVRSLERLGCQVDAVENGDRAIALVEQALAAGTPYQVVILDLTVVDGMGGAPAMERIRSLAPDVRGIVSSGYSNDPVLARPEEYGFDARLEKPYTLDVLTSTVARVLGETALSPLAGDFGHDGPPRRRIN